MEVEIGPVKNVPCIVSLGGEEPGSTKAGCRREEGSVGVEGARPEIGRRGSETGSGKPASEMGGSIDEV